MEYSNEIIINCPRKKIVEMIVDPNQMKRWTPSLKEIELISGKPFTKGAKTKLIFETGDGLMEMIEIIEEIVLPQIYNCRYDSEGVINWSNNRFEQLSASKTKWVAHNIFKFSIDVAEKEENLIQAFSDQTMKDMEEFKTFMENLP